MKNADLPAMPLVALDSKDNPVEVFTFGLTKREAFAMAAMQGICGDGTPGVHHMPKQTARDAVAQADALLKELDKCK